ELAPAASQWVYGETLGGVKLIWGPVQCSRGFAALRASDAPRPRRVGSAEPRLAPRIPGRRVLARFHHALRLPLRPRRVGSATPRLASPHFLPRLVRPSPRYCV